MIKPLIFSILISTLGMPSSVGTEDLFYPMRTDWSKSENKVNISAYIFNDLNGNGSYDIGDRALADIAVSLSRGGTPIAANRTNLNGFANFLASTTLEDSPLSSAGSYEFSALIPRGWRVTTGNQTQQRKLIAIEGSPAGLGLSEILTPIGIARNTFIRGTYLGEMDGHIELQQDGSPVAMLDVTENDQFIWSVKRGKYTLITNGEPRPVVVGNYPVDVGLVGVPVAGYVNGTTSGNHILYTSSGYPGRIYADDPFSFLTVNLSTAWPNSEGEEAIFRYYRDDVLVMTDTIGLSAYHPISYQPLIEGITSVEISTKHYWQMVIDDLVVSTPPLIARPFVHRSLVNLA